MEECKTCANYTDFNEVDNGCYMCCKGLENNYKPKQTNADRIRSMTDEELAEFLGKTIWNEGSDLFDCHEIGCDNVCWKCDMYLKWLQSEAE